MYIIFSASLSLDAWTKSRARGDEDVIYSLIFILAICIHLLNLLAYYRIRVVAVVVASAL